VAHDYTAINYLCQSTAREVFCDWMLGVVDAGYGAFLVAGIHDELILEVPEDLSEQVAADVVRCASEVAIPGCDVPIVAESKIAVGSWSAAYEEA
jgi:DNA polymerase I-like protein with 3'-5' exonuclease and polymerase domains